MTHGLINFKTLFSITTMQPLVEVEDGVLKAILSAHQQTLGGFKLTTLTHLTIIGFRQIMDNQLISTK